MSDGGTTTGDALTAFCEALAAGIERLDHRQRAAFLAGYGSALLARLQDLEAGPASPYSEQVLVLLKASDLPLQVEVLALRAQDSSESSSIL